MSTSVKLDNVMDFFPEYLKDNDFFGATFLSAVKPLKNLNLIKLRYGYYFFTPYNIDADNYFPVSISISKKGTVEIDVESQSTKEENKEKSSSDYTKRKKQILAVKEKDGSYSISTRSVALLNRVYGIFNMETEQQQTFEKRNYDYNGELAKTVVRAYDPNTKCTNEQPKWNDSIPYSETTTYYLSPDDAIIEETRSNNGYKRAYYVTLTDGKIVSKQELTGDAYKECFDKYEEKRYTVKSEGRINNKQLRKENKQ